MCVSVVLGRLSLEERYQIVRSVGEECIQEDELRNLLANKPEPVCYDGFEPSGRMHIAQVFLAWSFLLSLQFHQALFHLSIFKLVDGYGMYLCNMIMSLFDIAFEGPKSHLHMTQVMCYLLTVWFIGSDNKLWTEIYFTFWERKERSKKVVPARKMGY